MQNINNEHEVAVLLQKLIQYQTVTPKHCQIFDYIESFLKPFNFKIIKIENNGVMNFFACNFLDIENDCIKEFDYSNSICFLGHVDVVPTGDLEIWTHNPFHGEIKEGKVYGRGAVDMKGAIASFLIAIKELFNENENLKISIMLTSDEEIGEEFGTKKLIETLIQKKHKLNFSIILVGEPTSVNFVGDKIKIGCSGSLNVFVKVTGKMGHVAYHQNTVNPTTYLITFLNNLKGIDFDETYYSLKSSYNFPKSNLEITSINVENNVNNVVPELAEAKFNIRFSDKISAKNLISFITNESKKYSACEWDINFNLSAKPFVGYSRLQSKFMKNVKILKNAIIEAHKEDLTGEINSLNEIFVGPDMANSDARFVYKYATTIEFGLKFKKAHAIDEFVEISDLKILKNIYKKFIKKFS